MTRGEEIDAALATASQCRQWASVCKALGLMALAEEYLSNARKAERWACTR